ncbi:MAG: ATP-grasp domain-containing protein [Treponema sp.]|jgi:biotin carboxylase|nr:ATP-grasp domain-containing protein [Treponema sp.]
MEIKRKQLIILGAGVMQGPAIRLAREMGLETIALDADPQATCASLADRFERIDLKDKEAIEALGRSLIEAADGDPRRVGIMTAGTDFSSSAAWAAERLGLPGIPYEAALNASDKERMRRCFKAAGLPSPEFLILEAAPGRDFSLPFPYPAVVKPVDNMGARGCRRADSPQALEAAAASALAFSRSGRVIVEEYMEGPEFSVDALIFQGRITICGLADRHIYFPPYFIEMGHTMPAALDMPQAESLLEVFCRGAEALGLTGPSSVGAAKGDIKLTPQGPMIGEIAARLSGGYMSGWTFPYASGVEVTRGAIRLALGEAPGDLTPRRQWTCAERAFISIPGRVRTVWGLKEAEAMPYVKNLFARTGEGSRVRFPENNVTKCGNIIAAAPDRLTAVSAAEDAARTILIRLEAPDDETDAFLAGAMDHSAGAWPPGAFPLPQALKTALEAVPAPELEPRPPLPPGAAARTALIPFPAFTGADCADYMGRSPTESLDAVRKLTGLALPVRETDGDEDRPLLGRTFWAALIRGGYQGAAYITDRFLQQW